MIVQILAHMPRWVIPLFFGLIYLGYLQSKQRSVSAARLVALPLAMFAMSFSGVISTFGADGLALACWGAAVAFALFCTRMIGPKKGTSYSAHSNTYRLPGSWVPLGLMMATFATKFAVGAGLAQHAGLLQVPAFIAAASLAYGMLSGIFLGRMAATLGIRQNQTWAASIAA